VPCDCELSEPVAHAGLCGECAFFARVHELLDKLRRAAWPR
jgi:hypothetical protein